ncbi:general secretion pathway protein [Bradyrhizobium sp. CCBAU 11434]|uniref:ExeA family protein n=1 Tax=Bradyrhizobium sp. CCBAU 11434 TaxID=1630885 RepID=UPI002304F96E|nr:AAA family ATPase [Bradyrhizobium sp. CCBAU 11434]MDA9521536.1 general secretion pathway protein [Bradyrhizobium sp. CCBAU 11434]
MYEAFYHLREKPFSILPDPDLIYWGKMHSMAFTMLEFGVMNNAGFTVITGEIGSGKTTLVRHLLKKVNAGITIGLISNSPQGRQELLQWILMSLNQPFDGDYANLFKRFQDYLYGQYAGGRRTILIIDEAQNLEPEALEHLRMLSNINADKFQILQLILVGQPQLRDLLLMPQLHQFAQRISSDFHLRPLDRSEVANYINFRLQAVGAHRQLFNEQACSLIASASGGIPRIINVLCDTSLVYGFANDQDQISEQLVRDVIADKQQYSIFPVRQSPAVP